LTEISGRGSCPWLGSRRSPPGHGRADQRHGLRRAHPPVPRRWHPPGPPRHRTPPTNSRILTDLLFLAREDADKTRTGFDGEPIGQANGEGGQPKPPGD